jgi:threonine/homoserine/homoserine lactone efflux protein
MLLWLGLLYGFLVSVPPTGPVALLVLECALGALGYGQLMERSPRLAAGFDLVSALLLAVIAARLVWGAQQESGPARASSGRGAVLTGLLLGLANPTRLVTWALVASLAGGQLQDLGAGPLAAYTVAVALGQLLWWATLVGLLRRAGGGISARARARLMNGTALAAMGLAAWLTVRAVGAWGI